MITIGWVVCFGLPLAVTAAAIVWPERISKDRTVRGIRERIEREDMGEMKPDPFREN